MMYEETEKSVLCSLYRAISSLSNVKIESIDRMNS